MIHENSTTIRIQICRPIGYLFQGVSQDSLLDQILAVLCTKSYQGHNNYANQIWYPV